MSSEYLREGSRLRPPSSLTKTLTVLKPLFFLSVSFQWYVVSPFLIISTILLNSLIAEPFNT